MGNRTPCTALVMVLGFGLSGCATSALWESHAFGGFNEPARPANVQVFRLKDDWLVRYDEVNDNSDRVCRRAYCLKQNSESIREHKMPRFVTVSVSAPLAPVHATVSTNGQEFTLFDGPSKVGTYELPVYPAPSGIVKQVLLTPCTLVADATIVGGLIATYWWLPAGAPGLAETH